MAGRICYHCKQLVDEGEPHDCWTTTESALTEDLSEDLQDAWQRLREEAVALGEQRIYASHKSIMFSRSRATASCGRRSSSSRCACSWAAPSPARRCGAARRLAAKIAHILHIRHRDQVEAPLTDWLREAYEWSELAATVKARRARPAAKSTTKKPRVMRKPKKKTGAVAKRAR